MKRFMLIPAIVVLNMFAAFSPAVAEKWQSDYGPISIIRNDDGVFEATYSKYPGGYIYLKNKGEGSTWTGYWRQDTSEEKCDTQKGGSFYHGKLVVRSMESGPYAFKGYWTYCDSNTSMGDWRAWE